MFPKLTSKFDFLRRFTRETINSATKAQLSTRTARSSWCRWFTRPRAFKARWYLACRARQQFEIYTVFWELERAKCCRVELDPRVGDGKTYSRGLPNSTKCSQQSHMMTLITFSASTAAWCGMARMLRRSPSGSNIPCLISLQPVRYELNLRWHSNKQPPLWSPPLAA